jgi:succinyl-CoA synthetase beta subunit
MLSTLARSCARSSQVKNCAVASVGATRNLNLHEYQSMKIMSDFGVGVPKGSVCFSPEEAVGCLAEVGGDGVVKAQALTGGRGLGHFTSGLQGGVHMVSTPEDATSYATQMIGQTLVTKQTGAAGIQCGKVFFQEKLSLSREMYFSIMMDRASQGPMIIASPAGGTSIEDVAAATPELIFTEAIDITTGPTAAQLEGLAKNLGFEGAAAPKGAAAMQQLYDMFVGCDCTMVEINPLAETTDGEVIACDAKINFDDNAAFRHQEIHAQRDTSQEDAREVAAAEYDLNYIGLDGSIGCLVNGAGLAMATMDIIQLFGGSPANFLDVGGGATPNQVQKAFEILDADPQVKAILVNIFGGIMKCDDIATGIIMAAKNVGLNKPIVIRLEGTNVEKAKKLISEAGMDDILIQADNLDNAAQKAVKIANEAA